MARRVTVVGSPLRSVYLLWCNFSTRDDFPVVYWILIQLDLNCYQQEVIVKPLRISYHDDYGCGSAQLGRTIESFPFLI